MRKKFFSFLLKMMGWKCKMSIQMPDKCVYCVAPHTSNWDFIMGELFYSAVGGKRKAHFLIKSDWFFFPMNYVFNWLGGVPVYRGKKGSLVEQMTQMFNQNEFFSLAITPEGTRQANPNWKKGFYYIAKNAGVPIVLVYFDYANKVAGAERIMIPSDDEEKDIQEVKEYYSQFKGKYPDQFAI